MSIFKWYILNEIKNWKCFMIYIWLESFLIFVSVIFCWRFFCVCWLILEGFCYFYFTRRNWGLVWLRNCIQDCKFTDWTKSIDGYAISLMFHHIPRRVKAYLSHSATMFWWRKSSLRHKLAIENQFTFQSPLIVFHYIVEGTCESTTNAVNFSRIFSTWFFAHVHR